MTVETAQWQASDLLGLALNGACAGSAAPAPLTLAPLIGLFRGSRRHSGWRESPRVRAVAAEAAVQGALFGVFGTSDIDFETGMVSYRRLGPGGWAEWLGPLPDVVMNRTRGRSDEDRLCAERLRTVAPFTTRLLPGKRTMAEVLLRTPVWPHVIPFRAVGSGTAAEAIADFLAEHPRAVLKPSAAGRQGREILFLARDGDDIVVRELDRRWRLPVDGALSALAARVAGRAWIIQRYIVSRTRDGRAFDVRVHVHRDGSGRWAVVRAYVRLSEAGLLVSNTSRGGYQGDLEPFLGNLGDRGRLLAERIRRLGIETGEAIDSVLSGANEELGVDVLIDTGLHPWIVEVNAGPQSRFHEFERARFAVAYALYLARRHRDARPVGAPPEPGPGPGATTAA